MPEIQGFFWKNVSVNSSCFGTASPRTSGLYDLSKRREIFTQRPSSRRYESSTWTSVKRCHV